MVSLDLGDPTQEQEVLALAEELLRLHEGPELDALEEALLAEPDTPLKRHLAVKLARSRRLVEALPGPVHVSVVFAMYKEHTRILTAEEHPQGEDFLVRKVAQLDWLFRELPQHGWDLTAVDDGCPEASGRLAQRIAEERLAGRPVTVRFLQDAIDEGLEVARGLTTTRDSQKGGSILYGMWCAAREEHAGAHAVVFTDADLSTHLGQVGLLLDPLVRSEALAAIGSRRERQSVVVKKGTRNVRGKLFIYLWKRMLHSLDSIVDTQCGFKAFRADFIREAAPATAEKRFAVDLELLLRAELARDRSAVKVPVCWIDSDAASTTTDLQPYLPMLQSTARMYRELLPADPAAEPFAAFLEGLDEPEWQRLLDRVPPAIAEREPMDFGAWAGVGVAELAHRAGRDVADDLRPLLEEHGLPELAIASFLRHYRMLLEGETGTVSEAELAPVGPLPDADDPSEELAAVGRAARDQVVMIKLNGGLGTSMGLRRAKSLLPVRGEQTFLHVIARQAQAAGCPLVLMNSFATRADSRPWLGPIDTPVSAAKPRNGARPWAGVEEPTGAKRRAERENRAEKQESLAALGEGADSAVPRDFLQHKVPKLDRATLEPVAWRDEALRWCPPGHGDLYAALTTSGTLDALLAAGRRYAFVSNADNLGAVLDDGILGLLVRDGLPFLMEVADRTEADRKGGHLAVRGGRLILREAAQCPADELADFQDIGRYRYFNTNSIWLDLAQLRAYLDETGGPLPLPLIRNAKVVDPTDPASTPVYQLESAMGAAIEVFAGAQAIRVPRTRFAPVKTTSDLLRVRSDAVTQTEDGRLIPTPGAAASPVVIELDPRFYRHIGQLDARFPHGPPSLVACTRLAVTGDVSFGAGVRCVGEVVVEAAEGESLHVPDGAVLGA